jgi:peptidyl-tRNA hydrolase
MRDDMDSLNPGKACAQAHHAGSQIIHHYYNGGSDFSEEQETLIDEWLRQTGTFGTVIVLSVGSEEELFNFVNVGRVKNLVSDYILDPTYPVKDGRMTHLVPVFTCCYILCRKKDAGFLSELELMK